MHAYVSTYFREHLDKQRYSIRPCAFYLGHQNRPAAGIRKRPREGHHEAGCARRIRAQSGNGAYYGEPDARASPENLQLGHHGRNRGK